MADEKPIYKIDEYECTTTEQLAEALVARWQLGVTHIEKGYIGKWLEEELKDYDARIFLDELLAQYPASVAAMFFSSKYLVDSEPCLQGLRLTADSIRDYLAQQTENGRPSEEAIQLTYLMYRYGLLSDERVVKDDAHLPFVDKAWHREFQDYCRTRGEMLLYADIWKDPTGVIAADMYTDPAMELACAKASESGDDDSVPDHRAAEAGKVILLAELLDSDDLTDQFQSPIKVEDHPDFTSAMGRAWFADMVSRQPRSGGREVFLRHAADLASNQEAAGSLHRMADETNGEALPAKTSIASMISKLDRRLQAGLFGLLMFISLLYVNSGMRDPSLVAILFCGFAFIATVGWVPFRMVRFGPGGKALCFSVSALVYLVGFAFYEEGRLFESIWGALLITGVAALAGWWREPMLAIRAKRDGKKRQEAYIKKYPNTAARISLERLGIILMPEQLAHIPREKWTLDDHRRMAALRVGQADPIFPTVTARRSEVAANHGDGASVSIAGVNLASDGTTTFEIMDGVSIDNKGGFNTRVLDGVTLHSDGKTTTEILEGVSLRSDGQVTTDFLGTKLSFGGKEKKKKPYWQND